MSWKDIESRSFSFATGLLTLDSFEGYQLVRERVGIPVEVRSNAVRPGTDYFVVTDALADGSKQAKYVEKAKDAGVTVIGEMAFWKMVGIELSPEGVADHWVVVDTNMESMQRTWESRLRKASEDGNLDKKARGVLSEVATWARSNAMTENKPSWDDSVAPYTLFIQHGSAKSTSLGGWNIIACGFLSGDEQFSDNVGSITRLLDGTIVMDTLNRNAVPWAEWRNDIGKVIVTDRYAPSSCAYLFDGLPRCAEYDLLGLDTSNATTMRAMFRGSASVDYFMTTDRFKTGNVTNMSEMFFGCINARVINCIGWDLSKVETMYMMFENSPAAVLFDDMNVPIPNGINTDRMFDTKPKEGRWLRRI